MPVALTIACADYDRTRPIIDGRIAIAGCAARVASLDHEDMFLRALGPAEFDVTELSFSRFAINVARGTTPYIGIPAFPSRVFRHSAIYIRTDRGIREPADLKGRVIGVRDYTNTVSLVVRGMLEDEYGIGARAIRWRIGDVDHAERAALRVPELPAGFEATPVPPGGLLGPMLAAGEIDGLIDYQPPACFATGHAGVGRLFPDHREAERAYFTRTGIFPIMHLMVIRREIAERHPWIARKILDAFEAAKRLAIADLWTPGAPRISLPWVSEHYSDAVALMGSDFWPYGIAANRAAIAAIPRYVHAQGLSPRLLGIEELFAPGTLAS